MLPQAFPEAHQQHQQQVHATLLLVHQGSNTSTTTTTTTTTSVSRFVKSPGVLCAGSRVQLHARECSAATVEDATMAALCTGHNLSRLFVRGVPVASSSRQAAKDAALELRVKRLQRAAEGPSSQGRGSEEALSASAHGAHEYTTALLYVVGTHTGVNGTPVAHGDLYATWVTGSPTFPLFLPCHSVFDAVVAHPMTATASVIMDSTRSAGTRLIQEVQTWWFQ